MVPFDPSAQRGVGFRDSSAAAQAARAARRGQRPEDGRAHDRASAPAPASAADAEGEHALKFLRSRPKSRFGAESPDSKCALRVCPRGRTEKSHFHELCPVSDVH